MNFKTTVAFVVGAAVGSIVTWKLLQTKYEQIAQEEIDSVKKAYFNSRDNEEKHDDQEIEEAKEESTQIIENEGYTQLTFQNYEETKEVKDVVIDAPYVIAPGEFGELYEYETISLTYYADGILADELDYVIENIEDTVGEESLEHFGEYEDDSVFVRNDRLKHDYEILKDYRNYSDIVGTED